MGTYISRKNSYAVLIIINVVLALVRFAIYPNQTVAFHLTILFFAIAFFILAWEILLWMHQYFEKHLPIDKNIVLRLCIEISLTTVILIIQSTTLFQSASWYFHLEITPLLDKILYLLNFLLAAIFNLVLFGTQYFYKWKSDLIKKVNLEKEQAVVKYDALRNQLNPHFLFNALTSLNSLIFDDQKLASSFLQQLSKVYRYILQHKDHEKVAIRTELDFAKHYIYLLKIRFAEAIDVKLEVKEDDLDKGVVPVLSQMLIENAVKHNIILQERPLNISIISDGNYFIVENNVNKKESVETSNKVGMKNLKDLYKYLCDSPVEFYQIDNRFVVKVPLI